VAAQGRLILASAMGTVIAGNLYYGEIVRAWKRLFMG
jgi:hypothetical protein